MDNFQKNNSTVKEKTPINLIGAEFLYYPDEQTHTSITIT